jgi:hypothetical protein
LELEAWTSWLAAANFFDLVEIMDILLRGPVLGKMLLHLDSSASALVQFGLLPIAKVLVLSGFGLAMANPYILPAPSRRLLSKVITISRKQLS